MPTLHLVPPAARRRLKAAPPAVPISTLARRSRKQARALRFDSYHDVRLNEREPRGIFPAALTFPGRPIQLPRRRDPRLRASPNSVGYAEPGGPGASLRTTLIPNARRSRPVAGQGGNEPHPYRRADSEADGNGSSWMPLGSPATITLTPAEPDRLLTSAPDRRVRPRRKTRGNGRMGFCELSPRKRADPGKRRARTGSDRASAAPSGHEHASPQFGGTGGRPSDHPKMLQISERAVRGSIKLGTQSPDQAGEASKSTPSGARSIASYCCGAIEPRAEKQPAIWFGFAIGINWCVESCYISDAHR
jgi:hypothetical protein